MGCRGEEMNAQLVHIVCCRGDNTYCGLTLNLDNGDERLDADDHRETSCIVCVEVEGDACCWIDGKDCP
jgi:hypothetical protein